MFPSAFFAKKKTKTRRRYLFVVGVTYSQPSMILSLIGQYRLTEPYEKSSILVLGWKQLSKEYLFHYSIFP